MNSIPLKTGSPLILPSLVL